MKGPLVSVIIPVYNVSDYLERCLESIINQSLRDIEIIIINDDSPDQLDDKICLKYSKMDRRIKYIKLEHNVGLGGVRNLGTDTAIGQYQWHIDSDDFIERNACEFLYQTAVSNDVDILAFSACNFTLTANDSISYHDEYFSRNKSICNKIVAGGEFLKLAREAGVFYSATWLNFVKSSFLKDFSKRFKYRLNCAHQDTDFTPIMFTEDTLHSSLQ